MNELKPTTPLITLVVEPTDSVEVTGLLASFHPIMKELGFGNFHKQEDWLYSASKPSESVFRASDNVFAEIQGNQLIINIEGESIFSLDSIEMVLQNIKQKYLALANCQAHISKPDYKSVLLGNLLFTALPVSLGAVLALAMATFFYNYDMTDQPFLVIYIVAATVATKTRFWISQRKKNRPAWVGSLILFCIPLAVFGALAVFVELLNLTA